MSKFKVSKYELTKYFHEIDAATWRNIPDFIILEGELVEEEDPLAEYSCGKCIHYKTYEFCQCKCHKPAPQLPEELADYKFGGPAENVLFEEMPKLYKTIDAIIRYLKHHERN